MIFKEIIRKSLVFLHLDLTKNLKYDRLTTLIMRKELKIDSNCIDVGCHKGEILDLMFKFSPKGSHYAFEPIPYLYNDLATRFKNRAEIYSCALSDTKGNTTFHLVKNAPAYSGIKKRRYDISNPEIEEINVELRTLDSIIPKGNKIDLIKIDVEGGEFGVLKGAKELIKRDKPIIIFECGMGASDFYGTDPKDLFDYINKEFGMSIFTLSDFSADRKSMTIDDFAEYFENNKEYYFVASR